MDNTDACHQLGHPVASWLEENGYTMNSASKEAGIQRATLRRLINGHGCTFANGKRLIDWSWKVSDEGLRNADLVAC